MDLKFPYPKRKSRKDILSYYKENRILRHNIYDNCDFLLNWLILPHCYLLPLQSPSTFSRTTLYSVKMKRKGLILAQFPISSPNFYNSGNLNLLCLCPLPFLYVCSELGTKSIENRDKIKLELGNINGLDDALSLYKDMIRMSLLLLSYNLINFFRVCMYAFSQKCAIWGFQFTNTLWPLLVWVIG